jgi:SCP-2 sterol transfer family protein
VATHPFLSDDWFAVVDQLVEQHGADTPNHMDIVINLTVTGTPFGAERSLHIGAQQGRGHWGIGHLPNADVSLTTDYETARSVFVSNDPQAATQAFFGGKVVIQGDLAKLMAVQMAGGPTPVLLEAIQGITS